MKKTTPYFIALLAICSASTVRALSYDRCLSQAHGKVEQTYCKIRSVDPSAKLPDFRDFQNNSPKIQVLLLKPHANRLNIVLPVLVENTFQNNAHISQQSRRAENENSQRSRGKEKVAEYDESWARDCRLQAKLIICSGWSYALSENKNKNELDDYALTKKNQMNLPDRHSDAFVKKNDQEYLNAVYPIYIQKMLEIGLGDSTMSFTKFANIYWELAMRPRGNTAQNPEHFASRMNRSFEMLKKEKQQNFSKRRYSTHIPKSLKQCYQMNSNIVLCDDIHKNWVYERISPSRQ